MTETKKQKILIFKNTYFKN